MIFMQQFDTESSIYTYSLADKESRESIFIDPVAAHVEDYLKLLENYGCKLKFALETHIHSNHVSGSGLLRQ